eukprot:sb/3466876/
MGVGGSASECDTIPGRQCMASCYFLLKQFEDVLIYLNSIKSYFYNEDPFNYNCGQAKAATGNYKEAEEIFLMIQSEKLKSDYVYLGWLARCYIMNRKPRLAWELYLKQETSSESFSLLQLIANDCYKMGQFYYSAKAFDVLERLDPNPEYWEGKRGACIGLFQQIIAGHEPRETLREVLAILRNTAQLIFYELEIISNPSESVSAASSVFKSSTGSCCLLEHAPKREHNALFSERAVCFARLRCERARPTSVSRFRNFRFRILTLHMVTPFLSSAASLWLLESDAKSQKKKRFRILTAKFKSDLYLTAPSGERVLSIK